MLCSQGRSRPHAGDCLHSYCPGLTSPQAHTHSSDHKTHCSDPATCHALGDSAVPRPPHLPARCPPAVTSLLLPQQRRQRPRLGQLLVHITAKPVRHPTAMALQSYRSTHPAFYHLASHGNPPNPWEPACMRESPNTTNPSCFPSQCKYIMAGQDVIFPPCPTARCIRRGSSFISEKPGSPTRRAGTSWDLSYTGTGDTKDDYTSLLRDFGHGAELG